MERPPLRITKAKECPHFITAQFVIASGQNKWCRGCIIKPVIKHGQYGKPGPTNRQRTTKSDPAGKGHLKRAS